jgi:hypothetical protein
MDGVLWRSLLDVGRAQWPGGFSVDALDVRFIPYFDRQQRIIVSVPRQGGPREVVGIGGVVTTDPDDRTLFMGIVEVPGFDVGGQRFVGADPSEGRLDQAPSFVLRTPIRREPVPVTDEMRIEGVEQRSGRFRMLAGATEGILRTPAVEPELVDAQP